MFRTLYKAGIAFLLLVAPCAQGAEPPVPLHFNGQYLFTWNGITLGSLSLGIEETGSDYHIHLLVLSQGLINMFTRHSDDTVATGMVKDHHYSPLHYESFYKTKNKPRHILLNFDKNGVETTEINEPPEDPKERPIVPHSLKDGAYDPLTLLMVLRAGGSDIRGFDAKRLFQVKAVKGDVVMDDEAGKPIEIFPLLLSRTPLAGLTAKETAAYAKGEPPLQLFFSNDARKIPVSVHVPLFFGHVHGTLVKECATWDECKIN